MRHWQALRLTTMKLTANVQASMSLVLVLAAALLATAAGSPLPTCSCTKKLSKTPCVEGKTFGCLHDGTMWAVGCRGTFTCNGVKGVECSVDTPDPPRNHTCKCRSAPPPPPPPPARPEPAQPVIAAGFFTSNIFWPYEQAEDGTIFACTYLPTLVTANHTRLIAHGSCSTGKGCDGFHAVRPASPTEERRKGGQEERRKGGQEERRKGGIQRRKGGKEKEGANGLGANPIVEGMICQKHSDDGGRTWTPIRVVARGVMTGQIVWDDVHKVLLMQYSTVPPSKTNGSPGNGVVLEYRSSDLGA
jgi:hypothetical protein